ncbi:MULTISPECIES: hypothetical protein [unclassified Lacinutrix]
MTYEKIIIGAGALMGLFLLNKTKPVFLKVTLLILVSCSILSFYQDSDLINTISFLGFGILALVFSIYSGINKKWLNLIIGLFAFVSFFFKVMYYPYANELKLSMIIPIIIYIVLLIKNKLENNQLSILTILVAYELTEFLKLITLWID